MALETRLAEASMPVEDQRDPHAIYNMRDLPALAQGRARHRLAAVS